MDLSPHGSPRSATGSSLVQVIQDKAAQNGEPVGIATTTALNVQIYNSMGFETRGHKLMPSPWKEWEAWVLTMETKTRDD